ncbi:MAG: flagellin [Methanocalculus sp.]|uniref:flagellin n=1 Tax=Methanocalculus sp. TaxID=2004547 RepID=UPI0027271903|nr:flagellin [Methanocalculus sp.]MDO9540165.1 flagellin [Methanocalculus sp.]
MDEAFTGLEAGIVLISFVVVAAVFSHMVIVSGISLSEGARTEVHQGVYRAGSALQVAGTIYAVDTKDVVAGAEQIRIPVQLTPGSQSIDLRRVTIRFTGLNQFVEITPGDPLFSDSPGVNRFSIAYPLRQDQNPILEPGELVVILFELTSTKDTTAGSNPTVEIFVPGILPLRNQLRFPSTLTKYTPVG